MSKTKDSEDKRDNGRQLVLTREVKERNPEPFMLTVRGQNYSVFVHYDETTNQLGKVKKLGIGVIHFPTRDFISETGDGLFASFEVGNYKGEKRPYRSGTICDGRDNYNERLKGVFNRYVRPTLAPALPEHLRSLMRFTPRR